MGTGDAVGFKRLVGRDKQTKVQVPGIGEAVTIEGTIKGVRFTVTSLRPRMKLFMHLMQQRAIHVRVDLSSDDRDVT